MLKDIKNKCVLPFIILLLSFLCWYLYNEYKTIANIHIISDTIHLEYGQEYVINKTQFIENITYSQNLRHISNEKILSYIDLDLSELAYEDKQNYLKPGKYNINILCTSDFFIKTDCINGYSVIIQVDDTTAPEIIMTNSILNWQKGEYISRNDILNCFEISDMSNVRIEFDLNTIDINKLGIQKLKIAAIDNYNNKTKTYLSINIKKKIDIKNSIFQKDGDVSDFSIIKAQYIYNRLPNNIKLLLNENSWQYYITKSPINGTYYQGNLDNTLSGVTNSINKTVYIHKDYLYDGLLHEIGHVIDYELGNLSSTEEFNNIYIAEQEAFSSFDETQNSYYLSSPSEFFAEAVEIFIENPSRLKNKCPFLYNYIYEIMSEKKR